ncbi:MAG: hypothetical protein IJU39_04715 [Clostridia bacterium]|nr:hypothetical protein [Clostridia bacterium]
MKKIRIADSTLCANNNFTFKEKIEIARHLENLNVDVIELPEIKKSKTDTLLVRTISSFVKNSVLSVAAGSTIESIDEAVASLSSAAKGSIRISLPMSPVGMEYSLHKKAPKMLEWIEKTISYAVSKYPDVEFSMSDVTRAEEDFIADALKTAVKAGAKSVCFCDTAALMLPDEFASFIEKISKDINIPVGVSCSDKNGLACADAILAVKKSAEYVRTSVCGELVDLETFATMLKNCGNNFDVSSNVKYTELNRTIKQIKRIADNSKDEKSSMTIIDSDKPAIRLDEKDSAQDVQAAVKMLGYDLSDEDSLKVFEEFKRVAAKKTVGAKELDAIVASVSLQVPEKYKLISYVTNNGNIISSSAQITLEKDGETLNGICIGDGPIDAAFHAVEQITGNQYELDDFQIQSVTEGKEAVGSAIVKLRCDGKLFSGNGISTDIIGAAVRAYINAVNKIAYEEDEK